MATRRYSLGRRLDRVAETRKRIVEAARRLFLETGFHQVSVDEVAQRAGVGRTTVFAQFESKSGLLRAVEEEVSARAGVAELLVALQCDDALSAHRAAFRQGAQVWAREQAMFHTLYGLATIDAEMREVMLQKEKLREGLVASLVARLARQGRLRPGCSRTKARRVLMLLTSFESFAQLRAAGASVDGVAELLLELAGAVVSDPEFDS